MDGPDIIVRTLSMPAIPDKYGNVWQYHSRSDRHSKVACWAILFDVLRSSALLTEHIANHKVSLGVNRQMRDLSSNRTKNLDLVVSRPGEVPLARQPSTMKDLALRWGVRLSSEQQEALTDLPPLLEGSASSVLMAIEAKACMTAHIKALPRLFDELTASYTAIHADTEEAVAVGLAMINAAPTFISADMNKFDITERKPHTNNHPPHAAKRAVEKMREVGRHTAGSPNGFDAFGALLIEMFNNNTPVRRVTEPPAPKLDDDDSYERMIANVVQVYERRFCEI